MAVESSATVSSATRFVGELRWGVNVSIVQEPGSIVLVLLVDADHIGYEPCPEFGSLCCVGENLRAHVWGGDVGTLDELKDSCDSGVKDSWKRVLGPLSERSGTAIGFGMDDMRDTWRVATSVDGLRDVRVLTLVVQVWGGCDGGVNNKCMVRLKGVEKTLSMDLSIAQRASSVTISGPCTSDKPLNSFWLPSSDPAKCEWFCDSGYSRCPGYNSVSSVQTCYLLPLSGAMLRVTAALTVSTPLYGTLDAISSSVARRFRDAGIMGTEDCAVIIRNEQNESSLLTHVDLPVVNGRIRVISESHYDGVVLREAVLTDNPNEPIPIELDDIDDRLLPGFSEITLLVYSNNTNISLATQAVLLRYVLFDTLRVLEGVGNVLYVSDVQGVMRGRILQTFSLTWIQIVALCCWVFILSVLSLSSIFGPWRCISGTKYAYGRDKLALPPVEWCGEHSPKDRVLLTFVFIGVVGIIPVTVVLYLVFVLPIITSSDNVMNPFIMLGWLWVMIILWIMTTIVCCYVSKYIRRSV
ncbi:hypothetical protein T484DRAFT_1757583 [Baffinella frigidus]|nr:hypothetical protein T484DRAFT_1757583 [Cryptophyta sp. CCMP2293]